MQPPSPLPPIWVLSLKRLVERRARLTRQLSDLDLPFELVEAIDGSTFSPEILAAAGTSFEALRLYASHLAPGEVGCSLSHLQLYRKQLDEGWDEVVILEDDAVVDPIFREILSQRGSLPPDWEVVKLVCYDTSVSFWRSRKMGPARCVKFASIAWGNQGYLLRRSGAEKLLAHGYPVRVSADYLVGGGIRTGIRLYGIDPPCVREWSRDASDSTVPEARALRPRWPMKEELGPVLWFLHRWKWRLIHFYQRANPFRIL